MWRRSRWPSSAPCAKPRATTGEGKLVGLVALRLKVVNNKITEVEQLAIRPDNTAMTVHRWAPPRAAPAAGSAARAAGGAAPAAGAAPGSRHAAPARRRLPARRRIRRQRWASRTQVYFEAIPAAKRPSRDELIKTANYYFTGLQRNDGKGYYPFTDDCVRYENGMITTARQPTAQPVPGACKKQFEDR